MVVRTTMSHTNIKARSTSSRASVREIDDKHLMQQVKKADVYHSETPSDFERWQMVGLTAVPLKQEEKKQSQNKSQATTKEGDWNHDQPQGKSAEAVMLYLNGDRNHPVAMIDDRRVRPYAMKEGETAFYSASGTGQMLFHNDKGSYLVVVNNPPEQAEKQDDVERFASLRHVNKKKQSREIKEGEEVKEHPHEGETINTEVRMTKTRIEFRVGDEVVGFYDKGSKTWAFIGEKVLLGDEDAEDKVYGDHKGIGKITKKVYVKATLPGPPTELDSAP